MKSFVKKDGSGTPPEGGGRNPTVNFKGETRANGTHASTTDPDARLYKKSEGDKSRLCYIGHALMVSIMRCSIPRVKMAGLGQIGSRSLTWKLLLLTVKVSAVEYSTTPKNALAGSDDD